MTYDKNWNFYKLSGTTSWHLLCIKLHRASGDLITKKYTSFDFIASRESGRYGETSFVLSNFFEAVWGRGRVGKTWSIARDCFRKAWA